MTSLNARLIAALADSYRIERELGQGGMATVYLAEDLKHKRHVALKVLRPELAAALGAERFLHEIRVTSRLQHPNILPLFDSGEAGGFLYYVMPYVEGETLRSRIDRERQLSVTDAVEIARDVAGALKHAHDAGIIHRDIKPENILLRDGRAFVADFGIALAAAGAGTRLTETGLSIGTPSYMSPEQATADRELTPATDQYALASVVYELLAGDPPFAGSNAQAVVSRILTQEATPVDSLRDGLPPGLSAAVSRGLAKTPADRFESVSAFGDALRAAITGPQPGARAARGTRSGARGRLVGAAAALLLVAAGWWASRRSSAAPPAADAVNYLAIFPFAYDGDPSRAFVGASIGHLLGRAIDGVGPLRTADPAAVRAQLENAKSDVGDPVVGRALAQRLGAGRFVVGTIVQTGTDRLLITATIYDVASGAERGRASAEGTPDSLSAIVVRLSTQMADALGITRGQLDLERFTTASPAALSFFLRGANHADRGRHDLAVPEYVQAVHEDPRFALAWQQLAWEMTWTATPGIPGAFDSAVVYQDRLSDRDRHRLLSTKEYGGRNLEGALRHAQWLLDRNPNDADGLYLRANVEQHFGPVAGLSTDGVVEQWQHLLVVSPNSVEGTDHLVWAASRRDDRELLARALASYIALAPDNEAAPAMRISLAALKGDSAAVSAELQSVADRSSQQLVALTNMLFEAGADATLQRRLLAMAVAPGKDPLMRRGVLELDAMLSMARGEWSAGRAALRDAAALPAGDARDQLVAAVREVVVAIDPFAPATPASDLQALRQRVESLSWTPGDRLSRERFRALRAYALGTLAAHAGDRAAASRFAAELTQLPDTGRRVPLPGDLARRVRAHVAAVENRPDDVIRELEGRAREGYAYHNGDWFSSGAVERLLLAQALEAVGRDRDALRWYETLWTATMEDMAYVAPSRLHRGEILERLGERAKAREQYALFLAATPAPDPDLVPLVEDVRRRITRLEAAR